MYISSAIEYRAGGPVLEYHPNLSLHAILEFPVDRKALKLSVTDR